ncbi:MAG: VCBS repeat-containing protein [Spirochaetales bacterium]|nr:VCBS repeat-containing protein [Spirochaetales bacterium]
MDSNIADHTIGLHSETDDSFKKYRTFFRPAKYLVPVAIFALLMGSCDPEAAPPGSDDPPTDPVDDGTTDDGTTDDGTTDDDTTIDPATVLGNPAFKAPVPLSITGLSVSNYYIFVPALADVDADGDLDLLVGFHMHNSNYYSASSYSYSYSYVQSIKYLKNETGTAAVPAFTLDELSELTGFPKASEYAGGGAGYRFNGGMFVAAGTIDDDADIDIVAASNRFWTGEAGNPDKAAYTIETNTDGLFTPIYSDSNDSKHLALALADLDGDGDLDLVLGIANTYVSEVAKGIHSYNSGPNKRIIYQVNDGTGNFDDPEEPASPVLVPPVVISDIRDFPIPSFADIDGDGDQDMFVVTYDTGAVTFYLNTGTSSAPTFEAQASAFSVLPSDGVKYFPAFGDMDGDTDIDVIVGNNNGELLYIENIDIDL